MMALPSIPEYNNSIISPCLVRPAVLKGGHPIKKGSNIVKYAGGFCVVYPYQTSTGKYAVRCWHAGVSDVKHRTHKISEALETANLPYFAHFIYFEDGITTSKGVQPIVVMDWVDAMPLKTYIEKHITESNRIRKLADDFREMVKDLHKHSFAHGDLQHGNILVRDDGSIVLVDYDSMYVPELKGMKDEIKGLPGYQHLGRSKNEFVSEKLDYFSELVIYISLVAIAEQPSIWKELNIEKTETLVFSADDIKSKGSAPIFGRIKRLNGLSNAVDKLIEFMRIENIDQLEPLEVALQPPINKITRMWGTYIPPKPESPHIDKPDSIVVKFGDNGYDLEKVKEAEETRIKQMTTDITSKYGKNKN